MYPPRFDYSAPATLPEALSELAQLGEDGRVLAGGQSLIPMMKLRLAAPAHLVDINRLSELSYIRRENGHLAIGALARHADIVASPLVPEASKVDGRCGPMDRRSPGQKPWNPLWVRGPLRPRRRLELGDARRGCLGYRSLTKRREDHPHFRLRRRLLHQLSATGRDGERGKGAGPDQCQWRRLHQARTQDRRLRHGRSSHPSRARRLGEDQRRRDRLDVGPHPQHEGPGGRVDLDGSNALRRALRRSRRGRRTRMRPGL